MLDDSEKQIIASYLKMAQLPYDILLEVKDHFENQIEDFMTRRNDTFEEALSTTKKLWACDLKLVPKTFYSFGKVPRIVKDMQLQVNRLFAKRALLFAMGLVLLQLLAARLFDRDSYFLTVIAVTFIILIVNLSLFVYFAIIRIRRRRTRAERYFYTEVIGIGLLYLLLEALGVYQTLPTNGYSILFDGVNKGITNAFLLSIVREMTFLGVSFFFLNILLDRHRSIRILKRFQTN